MTKANLTINAFLNADTYENISLDDKLVLPRTTKFGWRSYTKKRQCQWLWYPTHLDLMDLPSEAVYIKIDKQYHRVEKIECYCADYQILDKVTNKTYEKHELPESAFYGCPII